MIGRKKEERSGRSGRDMRASGSESACPSGEARAVRGR